MGRVTLIVLLVTVGIIGVVQWGWRPREGKHKSSSGPLILEETIRSQAGLEDLRKSSPERLRKYALAFKLASEAMVGERKFEQAQEYVDIALECEPSFAAALLIRAKLRASQENQSGALADLKAYLKAHPEDGEAEKLARCCERAIHDAHTGLAEVGEWMALNQSLPLAERLYRGRLEKSWPELKKMNLTINGEGRCSLDLSGQKAIQDLSPLSGLPLYSLHLNDTSVHDLAPLSGMRLSILYLNQTAVANLV